MHHQQQFTMPNPQMQKHSFIGGAGQSGLQMRLFLLSEDQKRVEVPQEITQMCRNIKNIAKAVPHGQGQHMVVQTKSREEHLRIVAEYCASQHYIKTTSTVPHPLRSNSLEESLPGKEKELGVIKHILDDF